MIGCETINYETIQNITKEDAYVNPSIGRIGSMYHDERNNRIKFFSPMVHTQAVDIEQLVSEGTAMMKKHKATRLNARFLYEGNSNLYVNLEAKIPLNNGHSGIELVFVGVNEPVRQDTLETKMGEDSIINSVLRNEINGADALEQGYLIEKLDIKKMTNYDIKKLVELYSEAFTTYTTDLNDSNVRAMIENSVVYGVRDTETGELVSTSVAEIATVNTNRGAIKICELSEMATKRTHRGKGLVKYATKELIEDIRDKVDLIYAEARACHGPINSVFHDLGFSYGGRLTKQCILSGDHDVSEGGPYENLNVWYMLPHKM